MIDRNSPFETRPPAFREQPLPETIRIFLAESERRILLHCEKLLAQKSLRGDERQRLLRPAMAAEEEIQRLGQADDRSGPRSTVS